MRAGDVCLQHLVLQAPSAKSHQSQLFMDCNSQCDLAPGVIGAVRQVAPNPIQLFTDCIAPTLIDWFFQRKNLEHFFLSAAELLQLLAHKADLKNLIKDHGHENYKLQYGMASFQQ